MIDVIEGMEGIEGMDNRMGGAVKALIEEGQ